MNVREVADELGLWQQIVAAVTCQRESADSDQLLDFLAVIPVLPSRATRRLGSYCYRGGEALCIRLQFAQEADQLRHTFLHEIAHACDHLSQRGRRRPQIKHGGAWRRWALALGIDSSARGSSAAVARLQEQRQKLVAICLGCGAKVYRLRRLNRNRHYRHGACGAALKRL